MRKEIKYKLNHKQARQADSHRSYAKAYISRYKNRNTDMDDLYQEACLGLCDAANLFDPDRNVLFETFATPHMREKCDRFVKRYNRAQILSLGEDDDVQTTHASSLPDICPVETEHASALTTTSLSKYDEEEGRLSLAETLPDPDGMNDDERLNCKLLAERLLSILTERERNMVRCAFYIEHKSQVRLRIWQRFNLQKTRFYYIVERAIIKMALYAKANNIKSPFKF